MGPLASSTAHDHLSTHVLEKELFSLFSINRDPKTEVKDIGQGLALSWGKTPGLLTVLHMTYLCVVSGKEHCLGNQATSFLLWLCYLLIM